MLEIYLPLLLEYLRFPYTKKYTNLTLSIFMYNNRR